MLTGATFGRETVLAAAERLGVRDRVHHLGYVPPPPSRRSTAARAARLPQPLRGLRSPPLEAMACGCPVAASDAGAVAEACAGAALTFDARDVTAIAAAITRVTTDDALREQLRDAGLDRARAFTWERAAARHTEVYAAASSAGRAPIAGDAHPVAADPHVD